MCSKAFDSTELLKREIIKIYKDDTSKPVNIAKEYTNLYMKACRMFGSWREAIEACGLNYESARNNKKWNRSIIRREIMKLKNRGYSLRPSRLREQGMTALVSAAEYHFGSWRRAVETCGYDYSCARGKETNGHCKKCG